MIRFHLWFIVAYIFVVTGCSQLSTKPDLEEVPATNENPKAASYKYTETDAKDDAVVMIYGDYRENAYFPILRLKEGRILPVRQTQALKTRKIYDIPLGDDRLPRRELTFQFKGFESENNCAWFLGLDSVSNRLQFSGSFKASEIISTNPEISIRKPTSAEEKQFHEIQSSCVLNMIPMADGPSEFACQEPVLLYVSDLNKNGHQEFWYVFRGQWRVYLDEYNKKSDYRATIIEGPYTYIDHTTPDDVPKKGFCAQEFKINVPLTAQKLVLELTADDGKKILSLNDMTGATLYSSPVDGRFGLNITWTKVAAEKLRKAAGKSKEKNFRLVVNDNFVYWRGIISTELKNEGTLFYPMGDKEPVEDLLESILKSKKSEKTPR